ncbi:MAG TPA: ADP-dependent glucokinase/phosphofructokinase [Candidatus Norongarragalinales archaeon]|nr:ADP-dependent glucokinase/phosphofructokinase [Candidatus Norongarragalinales archaeon]
MVHDDVLARIWGLQLESALEHPHYHMRRQRTFCAFNAITDAVVQFKQDEFRRQLLRCDIAQITGKIRDFSLMSIEDREGFLAAFLQMFARGKAIELPSHNPRLFEWFRMNFSEEVRMGGQAGIIANQLSLLDVSAVCYSPILSEAQSKLFSTRNLFFPVLENNRLVFKKPRAASKDGDPTKVNWIFEFKKGDALRFGKRMLISPRANRIIVASRPEKYRPLFPVEFEPHLHQLGHSFDVFFLAGFQSFQRNMDGISFRHHLRRLIWQIKQLKSNAHARFHLEYVAIHDPVLDKAIYPSILHLFDSFGINEVETVHFLKRMGDYHLADALERREAPMNYYRGIRHIFHKFKLKRLHAHTLGYFLLLLRKDYVGRKLPEEFVNSLLFASRVADARAFYGKAPAFADLQKLSHLKISDTGIKALKEMATELYGNSDKVRHFVLNGIHDAGDHYLIMVPTAIVKPKATVGLGDTISSVAFASEPF